jgi:hypothetical protein
LPAFTSAMQIRNRRKRSIQKIQRLREESFSKELIQLK